MPEDARSSHVDDQLAAALALEDTADFPDADLTAAREHLAGCPDCADHVASLREALGLLAAASEHTLEPPPARVWSAIAAEIAAEGDASGPTPAGSVSPSADPTASVIRLDDRRRGVPSWLATTAAAVTLVLGLGVGWQLAGQPDDPAAPQATVLGTAALASLDETQADRGSAEVRRQDGRIVLHVEAQELGGPDVSAGVREVWLINVDGTRMVSLGLLARGESGDFDFPQKLLDEGYRIVDISYEPDDGDPVHSGTSLARGTIDG